MQLVADRFLYPGASGEAVDLATGQAVRLFVETEVARRNASVRTAVLLPLVDDGADGRHWFEADAASAPCA